MLDSGSPSVLAQNYRTQETIGSPGLVNNKQVRMMMMTLMTMTLQRCLSTEKLLLLVPKWSGERCPVVLLAVFSIGVIPNRTEDQNDS